MTDAVTFFRHGEPEEWPAWLGRGDEGWGDFFAERWAGMPALEVHIFPRAVYSPAWFAEWFGAHDGPAPAPYAFRGFFNRQRWQIVLLVDETETHDSFAWLLIHELTHAACEHARFLRYLFATERDLLGITVEQEAGAGSDDALHERLPEEQFCNRAASVMIGACYDRLWWRRRVERWLAASSEQRSAA